VKRIGLLVVATLLAVAGCSKEPATSAPPPAPAGTQSAPAPTTSGSPTAPVSPTVTGSPQDVIEFSVDGAGPYLLGATLSSLQAAGALDEVTPGGAPCPDSTTARGTGTWADVHLSFHKDGALYLLVNKSPSVPTPSGAWLGTSLAELKRIYAAVTGQELTHGTSHAYLVTTLSGRGILFDLDTANRVTAMTAGDSPYMRATFQSGSPFC
jgi:hypothetical protein